MLALWEKSYDQLTQCIKKQRHHFADQSPYSQSYDFSSSHAWMWELDHKEGWVLKNWWFQTVVLGKMLQSPLDSKEIKLVNPKGNQSWNIHCKDWRWSRSGSNLVTWCEQPSHWKSPWRWKDWGQKKRASEDETAGLHHRCNGHGPGKFREMVRDREV